MILSVFATLSLAGQSAVLEVGAARQYKTIQAAADVAVAGDTVLIDAGVYREWVKPANAGTSDRPITYRARERGKVVISGADVIVGWRKRTDGLWEVKLPYDRFGGLNPFTDFIHGNWFEARNKETYPRAFLFRGRGKMRYRAKIEDFKLPYYNSSKMKYADGMIPAAEKRPYVGSFALKPGMAAGTVIADFKEDPNDGGTELVVRPCCFYPVVEFRDYQRLEGLVFCDAGPNWAGPHSEQLGVVGVNWSRGWVIEDCEIRGSTCAGLTLGKHGDEFDNYVQKSQRYTEAIDRAIKFGFDRVGHHTVRRCRIRDCGQAGVCGSLGAVFSTIADCDIGYCHWLENFDGCEMACIKLHGAVDVEIVGNELHHAGDFGGIWLDWMSQGTFVSRNRIHDLVLSRGDAGGVYIEVGHGPAILENNVIDARQAIHICGTHDVAIVGNELYGSVSWWDDPFKRSTPFWKPHSPVLDQMLVRCTTGGCRLYNNVMKLPVSCPLDARSVSVGNLVVSNRAAFAAAKRSAAFVPVDTATLGTNTLGQAFERRDGSPYVWRPRGLSFPGLRDVELTRGFWFDRLETNRTATLEAVWRNCEERGKLENFRNAAQRRVGTFRGIPFDDSDVFKALEGTAEILATHPDAALQAKMERLIADIAGAQEEDGYLYTARTLGFEKANNGLSSMMGSNRWSKCVTSHELYNAGHLYEAAVVWCQATGRDDLLKVAVKNADLVCRTFGTGEGQVHSPSGHEEIELALVRLYRETGFRRYLDLARHFIAARGTGERNDRVKEAEIFSQDGRLVKGGETDLPGCYHQNHLPFDRQRTAVGHAVRAAYLYCGATDVAALTGNDAWRASVNAIWDDVVGRKLHLTGGIGGREKGEAFDEPYVIRNACGETYLETCAAIGFALWNARLFLLTGDVKYMDVLERILYNAVPAAVSLSGDAFTYINPLAASFGISRGKWASVSCCPVNDIRFFPQVPTFAYATDGADVYVNLFMAGEATVGGRRLRVETDYPASGRVKVTVLTPGEFTLKVRVPGWARGKPVPGDLYAQDGSATFPNEDGYRTYCRSWRAGESVELDFLMMPRRIRAHGRVAADVGKVAVERGPLVFTAEACDNTPDVFFAKLPSDATIAETEIVLGDRRFPALKTSSGLTLVPFCIWGNRPTPGPFQTWFVERSIQ